MNAYLYLNNVVKGPFPFSEIESMRQRGTIVADTLYCTEGTEAWRPVSELPAARRGFFLTYAWPVTCWMLLWAFRLALAYIFAYLLMFVIQKNQAPRVEQPAQTVPVSTLPPLGAHSLKMVASTGSEEEKRISTFRQIAHDSMCRVFTAQLPAKMQAFLDMDYYLTIGHPHGAELGSKSGLVATRAVLESLAEDWPEGAQPDTFEEAAKQIQTYTVVFTIYWQTAEGTAAGFYQFEQRFNLQTGESLSVRLVQTGDI